MRTSMASSFAVVAVSFVASAAMGQTPSFPTLLQGTPVMLQLEQKIDGASARMGQRVAFEVSGDVKLGERVVIPVGSSALGTVTQVSRRLLGHGGRVSVNIDAVRLPGGQVVPLSSSPDLEDNGSGTVDDAIATNLVPAAAGERRYTHHKPAVIAEGTLVRAFVRRDTVIVRETASVSN